MKKITIHTDGACHGNPGPGGWAARLEFGSIFKEISGAEPATTNNRMELQAAVQALRALKEPCEVRFYTDSEYLRQGITGWIHGWKTRNWLTKEGTPVKNEDLWRALDEAAKPHLIHWNWLKGHAGDTHNERCDQLATRALEKEKQKYTRNQLKTMARELKERR